MESRKDVEDKVKQIDNNLSFYSRFWDILIVNVPEAELFKRVDFLLDRRSYLQKKLKKDDR